MKVFQIAVYHFVRAEDSTAASQLVDEARHGANQALIRASTCPDFKCLTATVAEMPPDAWPKQ